MSDLGEIESSEILKQSQMNEADNQNQRVEDEDVLKFMDSLDAYLCLLHSLSSTLRQVLILSISKVSIFDFLFICNRSLRVQ